MALLNILEFPDPLLRTKATAIEKVDNKIRRLADNMLETMYEASGIGLAATQVNVHKKVITIDVSDNKSEPHIFINPTITILDVTPEEHNEGCLSVPGFYETIKRPRRIRVNALNIDGKRFVIEPEGLMSVCIQHEIDHLNGKLFVDYISLVKCHRIRKKLEKKRRSHA